MVTPADKAKFDVIFVKADTNKDGLVSGNIFLELMLDHFSQVMNLALIFVPGVPKTIIGV